MVLRATRRIFTTYASRKSLNEESVGLLLSGVGELVAVDAGKAEVLVPPAPQCSPMRPHRPLYLVKGFKEGKKSHRGPSTESQIT